jgi:membrane protease YdiL (CAAX protease family)
LPLSLTLFLVAYNNVINRWGPFHGPAYVPVNLMVAATIAFVAVAAGDLGREDLGLRADLLDLGVGLAVVAVFAFGVYALVRSRHAYRIADARVRGMRGGALGFYVLVRIPLGTAVTEEVVFRGVLFAAWGSAGATPLEAALLASLAFGLWHIAPTIIGLRMNEPDASGRKVMAAVMGAVILTAVAGLLLTWLRVETGSLLTPIIIHAGVNSVGALGAARAHSAGADTHNGARANL